MDAKVNLPVTEKPKLSVRNLDFYYGGFHALKNITLDIPERRVTAFIGPSGCGKSTLLRTFNRMYELYPEQRRPARSPSTARTSRLARTCPDPGQDRHGVQKPTPSRCRSTTTSPSRREAVRVACRASRWTSASNGRLRKAALWNDVRTSSGQSGSGLSGGQQQRLCTPRHRIKPEVLLLDETCSALDPISTGKIEELITS